VRESYSLKQYVAGFQKEDRWTFLSIPPSSMYHHWGTEFTLHRTTRAFWSKQTLNQIWVTNMQIAKKN